MAQRELKPIPLALFLVQIRDLAKQGYNLDRLLAMYAFGNEGAYLLKG